MATPIGNLADITLRALHVLQLADVIACEDTRHTQALLRAYGIDKSGSQLLAVHQHNEAQAAEAVLARLALNARVAYVSDAGTPAISDPGARLTAAVRAAGRRCIPLPGASSITTALSVAGAIALDDDSSGFVFGGFLPPKSGERATAVRRWEQEPRCVLLLEAPHRIDSLAAALASLGARPVTLARELSKQFEEIVTLPAEALAAWLNAVPQRTKGEFVVILHPWAQAEGSSQDQGLRVLQLLLQELPLKTAVRLAADITDQPRNALYDAALALKQQKTPPG